MEHTLDPHEKGCRLSRWRSITAGAIFVGILITASSAISADDSINAICADLDTHSPSQVGVSASDVPTLAEYDINIITRKSQAQNPTPSYNPSVEKLREAVLLLGEGDRLAQREELESARGKWQAAGDAYVLASDPLGVATAYSRLADSHLLKPSAGGSIEALMKKLDLENEEVGFSQLSKMIEYVDLRAVMDPKIRTRILEYYHKSLLLAAQSYETTIRKEIELDKQAYENAEKIYHRAHDLYHKGNYGAAATIVTEARRLYRETEYGAGELRSLALRIRCFEKQGNPLAAMNDAMEAMNLAIGLPVGNKTTELHANAKRLYEDGQFQEALESYRKLASLYKEAQDEEGLASCALDVGAIQVASGNFQAGKRQFLKSLDMINRLDDTNEYKKHNLAAAHHNLANIYTDTGRPRAGLKHYCEALGVWRELGNHEKEVASLSGMGVALTSQGRHQDALSVLTEGWRLQQRLSPELAIEGDLLNNIGQAYFNLADYPKSIKYFHQAIEARRQQGDVGKVAETWSNLGAALARLGRPDEAMKVLQRALNLASSQPSSALRRRLLTNIAVLNVRLGKYRLAISQFQEALPVASKSEDNNVAIGIHSHLSIIFQKIGELDFALIHMKKAVEIAEMSETTTARGSAYSALATLYMRGGKFDAADEYFRKALKAAHELKNPALTALVNGQAAANNALQNNFSEAFSNLRIALKTSSYQGDDYMTVNFLNLAGYLYMLQKKPRRAARYVERASDLAAKMKMPTEQVTALTALAGTYLLRRDLDKTQITLDKAIELLEQYQGTLQLPKVKSGFYDQFFHVYALAAILAAMKGQYEHAFEYSEMTRARAFLDQLGTYSLRPASGDEGNPTNIEQSLRRRLHEIQSSIASVRREGLSRESNTLLVKLSREEEKLRIRYLEHLDFIREEYEEYYSLMGVKSVGIKEVQDSILREDTTLIEYFVTSPANVADSPDSWVFAWVINKESFKFQNLKTGSKSLLRVIDDLRNDIIGREDVLPALAQLHDVLIEPILPYIKSSNIIIVPHGVLHHVPFTAMWNEREKRFLVESHSISYAPSASSLRFISAKHNPNGGNVLVLGDPGGDLPYAASEAKAVADLFGSVARLGKHATERLIQESAGTSDILHLAAHGTHNPLQTLFSRIELNGDDEFDGRLESHEIYSLDLSSTNLVVLSACDTALGEQSPGDELTGITRAFLYAGSPAVVSTLWPVEDASSEELMKHFYRLLQEETNTAEALRQAQLEVMSHKKWKAPYYWAGYGLTGDFLWTPPKPSM